GDDLLVGGPKGDTMAGGPGDDTIFVQDAGDKVVELAKGGTDTVVASVDFALPANVENLTLTGRKALKGKGNRGANTIRGNAGNNRIDAGAGADQVHGGLGDDIIIGGKGADVLTGGGGADRFVYRKTAESSGRSVDTITDFSAKKGDRIDLSLIDADSRKAGNQPFDFIGSRAFSRKPGQLRFAKGLLEGDVNGDGRADIKIKLKGVKTLPKKAVIR
ncbi:MAG TPA: calcium-binding protein, partial [Methylomirabilota bacterium]|nr:calcium-binding protein [Methylomirabilota bacterium]